MDELEPVDVLSLLEGLTPLSDERLPTESGDEVAAVNVPLRVLTPAGNRVEPGASGLAVGQAHRSANSISQNAVKRKSQPRKVGSNPNRARNERREELVYLRSKVTDLETQLDSLKNDNSYASSSMIELPCEYRQSHCSVWAEIASRQCAERQQAELKNIMILEGQIKVAKGLEKLLNSKSNTQILQFADGDRKTQKNRPQYVILNHDDEAEIFQILIADLEKAVLQVDEVFQANDLSNTEEAFQDAFIRNDARNGMYLEVIGCKIMPFELHATGNAVWKHVTGLIESMPFRAY